MVSPLIVEASYRNPKERELGDFLTEHGIAFDYEREKLPVDIPARTAKYLPDFIPRNTGIILEFKGSFGGPKNHDSKSAEYRQKMILFKEQHPEWDLRFVFQNPKSKIYKGSKTTYAQWADDHGFKWCKDGQFPAEWLEEIKQQQEKTNDKPRKRSQARRSNAKNPRAS